MYFIFFFDITFLLFIAAVIMVVLGVSFADMCVYISEHTIQIVSIFWCLMIITLIITYFTKKTKYAKKRFLKTAVPLGLTTPIAFLFPLVTISNVVDVFSENAIMGFISVFPILLIALLLWAIIIAGCLISSYGFGFFFDGDTSGEGRSTKAIIIETIISLIIQTVIVCVW